MPSGSSWCFPWSSSPIRSPPSSPTPTGARSSVNTMLPHFLADKGFILLGVALIGTTITPYMQLYVAAAVADKGIGPEEYKFERIDAVGGALFGDIISMFIIIAAAATIGHLAQPLTSAKEAAGALEPVAGRFAEQIVRHRTARCLRSRRRRRPPLDRLCHLGGRRAWSAPCRAASPRRHCSFPSLPARSSSAASVALAPGNLIDLLIKTQVLNGIITPDHPDLHPDSGQPAQPARRCRQRSHLPGGGDRVRRRGERDVGHCRDPERAALARDPHLSPALAPPPVHPVCALSSPGTGLLRRFWPRCRAKIWRINRWASVQESFCWRWGPSCASR